MSLLLNIQLNPQVQNDFLYPSISAFLLVMSDRMNFWYVFVRRPSSSLAREKIYSDSQRRTRCGCSTRSTLYGVWPYTYWSTSSFPSSSSLQYWLTVYSWSCPPRPPSSPPSEYLPSFLFANRDSIDDDGWYL